MLYAPNYYPQMLAYALKSPVNPYPGTSIPHKRLSSDPIIPLHFTTDKEVGRGALRVGRGPVRCLFNYNCRCRRNPCPVQRQLQLTHSAFGSCLLVAGCRMQNVAGWERSIGADRVWVLPRLYLRRRGGAGAGRLFYAQLLLNISQNANIYFNMANWPGWSWCHVRVSVCRPSVLMRLQLFGHKFVLFRL